MIEMFAAFLLALLARDCLLVVARYGKLPGYARRDVRRAMLRGDVRWAFWRVRTA